MFLIVNPDLQLDERFQEGDMGTVTQETFKGIEVIFETYDGEKRAILLLNLLTKMTEAKFGLSWIKKAS